LKARKFKQHFCGEKLLKALLVAQPSSASAFFSIHKVSRVT